MSVKIRLSRGGTKKRPYYYIVVAQSASPRDGRYIEQVGTHNPLLPKDNADRVKLDVERIKHWLSVGAQPTDRVARFLDAAGLAKREAQNNPAQGQAEEEAPRARGRPGRSRGEEGRRRRGQAGGLVTGRHSRAGGRMISRSARLIDGVRSEAAWAPPPLHAEGVSSTDGRGTHVEHAARVAFALIRELVSWLQA